MKRYIYAGLAAGLLFAVALFAIQPGHAAEPVPLDHAPIVFGHPVEPVKPGEPAKPQNVFLQAITIDVATGKELERETISGPWDTATCTYAQLDQPNFQQPAGGKITVIMCTRVDEVTVI